MRRFFRDVRVVDRDNDFLGGVLVENGSITEIIAAGRDGYQQKYLAYSAAASVIFSGEGRLVLMPGFIDLHAHFREPGFPAKETLESASLAAVRGGWTTAVCMANTNPVIDTPALAGKLRRRAAAIGLIDLYPAISLTRGMAGEVPSWFHDASPESYLPPLFSEDGKDVANDSVFLAALREAARTGSAVSCHCDAGGEDAATRRAIGLGEKAQCRVHIAHVSTEGACAAIRDGKLHASARQLSAEATPHHIALTDDDARKLGEDSFGKVAPPLRTERDRRAVIEALRSGVIDAIATDHAPHTADDKRSGAPGFIGLETAFPVVHTILAGAEGFSLRSLSGLLSAGPARILGLNDRGRIAPDTRADLVIIDLNKNNTIPEIFASRGANSPYCGMRCQGEIVMTLREGRVVYER